MNWTIWPQWVKKFRGPIVSVVAQMNVDSSKVDQQELTIGSGEGDDDTATATATDPAHMSPIALALARAREFLDLHDYPAT
jgi:hypothetical protein